MTTTDEKQEPSYPNPNVTAREGSLYVTNSESDMIGNSESDMLGSSTHSSVRETVAKDPPPQPYKTETPVPMKTHAEEALSQPSSTTPIETDSDKNEAKKNAEVEAPKSNYPEEAGAQPLKKRRIDIDNIAEENCESPKTKELPAKPEFAEKMPEKKPITFPEKLMELLEDPKFQSALYWLPDGETWAVSSDNFTKLRPDGECTRLDSFTRKLNRWGFRRAKNKEFSAKNVQLFKHPLFKRDEPELIEGMSGAVKKTKILSEEAFFDRCLAPQLRHGAYGGYPGPTTDLSQLYRPPMLHDASFPQRSMMPMPPSRGPLPGDPTMYLDHMMVHDALGRHPNTRMMQMGERFQDSMAMSEQRLIAMAQHRAEQEDFERRHLAAMSGGIPRETFPPHLGSAPFLPTGGPPAGSAPPSFYSEEQPSELMMRDLRGHEEHAAQYQAQPRLRGHEEHTAQYQNQPRQLHFMRQEPTQPPSWASRKRGPPPGPANF